MAKHRRTVLVALAGSMTTGGCLGFLSSTDDSETEPTPTATVSPTTTPTTTPTASPTESVPDHIAEEPCPSFDGEKTVCNHTRTDGAEVYLTPSTYVFEPVEGNDSVETMTLILHNESDGRFTVGTDSWRVRQRRDGEWQTAGLGDDTDRDAILDPGGTYQWVLSQESQSDSDAQNTTHVTADLESDMTAFAVYGQAGTMHPILEAVALFDVAVMVAD